jgi:hypothetical protein
MRRAKVNTKRGEVKRLLGETAAEMTFSDVGEASIDVIMEQLSRALAGVDNSGAAGFSVSKLKEEYEEMLRRVGGGAAAPKPQSVALTRKTAAELNIGVAADEIMTAVRSQAHTPFNWALFRPSADPASLDFFNAGSLSVPEMIKWLRDDEVLCGLLRLAFGAGRFRRVKWVRARVRRWRTSGRQRALVLLHRGLSGGGLLVARPAIIHRFLPCLTLSPRHALPPRFPPSPSGLPDVVRPHHRRRQARPRDAGPRRHEGQAGARVRGPGGVRAGGHHPGPGEGARKWGTACGR